MEEVYSQNKIKMVLSLIVNAIAFISLFLTYKSSISYGIYLTIFIICTILLVALSIFNLAIGDLFEKTFSENNIKDSFFKYLLIIISFINLIIVLILLIFVLFDSPFKVGLNKLHEEMLANGTFNEDFYAYLINNNLDVKNFSRIEQKNTRFANKNGFSMSISSIDDLNGTEFKKFMDYCDDNRLGCVIYLKDKDSYYNINDLETKRIESNRLLDDYSKEKITLKEKAKVVKDVKYKGLYVNEKNIDFTLKEELEAIDTVFRLKYPDEFYLSKNKNKENDIILLTVSNQSNQAEVLELLTILKPYITDEYKPTLYIYEGLRFQEYSYEDLKEDVKSLESIDKIINGDI